MNSEIITPFRIIASDELGMLKVCQAPSIDQLDSLACTIKWGEPIKTRAIERLTISGTSPATALLAAGRISGEIDLLNPVTGVLHTTLEPEQSGGKLAAIAGLHIIPTTTTNEPAQLPAILSCTNGGAARLHTPQASGEIAWEEARSWKTASDVWCTAYDQDSKLFAVGCKGTELRLFDIQTANTQPTFIAKGGKLNAIRMIDAPWNTALAFLPGSEGKKILAGTGYHKFRLYDTNAGKRPQLDVSFSETRITALAPEPDGNRCWVANGLGQLEVYDFRAGKFAGAIKGIAGSIRSLSISDDGEKITSVGLDRFLRIHSTKTRASVGKVYLKTQLTGVGYCPMPAEKVVKAADGDAEKEGGGGERKKKDKRRGERGGSGSRKNTGGDGGGGGGGGDRNKNKHQNGGSGKRAAGHDVTEKKDKSKKMKKVQRHYDDE